MSSTEHKSLPLCTLSDIGTHEAVLMPHRRELAELERQARAFGLLVAGPFILIALVLFWIAMS